MRRPEYNTSYYDNEIKWWLFPDCEVVELGEKYDRNDDDREPDTFDVYMVNERGYPVLQTVCPHSIEDEKVCIKALNDGYAPTNGWEDGKGKIVHPDYGDELSFWIVVAVDGEEYKIELPDIEGYDVWGCVVMYDKLNGTNVFDITDADFFSLDDDREPSNCDDISFCPKFKQKKPKKSRRKI